MALAFQQFIDLPPHVGKGGFDHAAVHGPRGLLFVAHTVNDALDVVDTRKDRHLYSIPGLTGVAGALVSDAEDWVMTSNRGENTVSIFRPDAKTVAHRIPVGVRPNGMAYDPKSRRLLVAHVGDPAIAGSTTVSILDAARSEVLSTVRMPGKTRWAVFDPATDRFYVNIAEPAQIAVLSPLRPEAVEGVIDIPCAGPHGLDLDVSTGRLFCACDGGELVVIDAALGQVAGRVAISGVPDVVFFHPALRRLYVAVGDPGVVDVIDTDRLLRIQIVATEAGAKTTALDAAQNKLYVFYARTHRAAVFIDS